MPRPYNLDLITRTIFAEQYACRSTGTGTDNYSESDLSLYAAMTPVSLLIVADNNVLCALPVL